MSRTTRIRAEVLFDGHSVVQDALVEIRGEHVVKVTCGAQRRDRSRPEFDYEARFAMPGLVDSHVHTSGYRGGLPAGNPHSAAKDFVRLCLLNGITTLRDVGNSLDTIHYLKKWLDDGAGPRLYASGPLLDGAVPTWSFTRSVTTPEAAEMAIRRLQLEAVDFVKIYQSITPAVFSHLVKQAHAASLKVAFHSGEVSAHTGAAHGVDSLEHAINLVDFDHQQQHSMVPQGANAAIRHLLSWAHVVPADVARSMGEVMESTGTMLCPTLLVSRRWSFFKDLLATPSLKWASLTMPYHKYLLRMRSRLGYQLGKKILTAHLPIVVLDKKTELMVRQGYRKVCETVALLHQRGISILTGTDSPNPSLAPGFSLHDEIKELHQMCGISPLHCLQSATSVPARFLDQPVGIIEPGSYADLVLLNDDPTINIDQISSITHVICRGQAVDLEKLKKRLQTSLGHALRGGMG